MDLVMNDDCHILLKRNILVGLGSLGLREYFFLDIQIKLCI